MTSAILTMGHRMGLRRSVGSLCTQAVSTVVDITESLREEGMVPLRSISTCPDKKEPPTRELRGAALSKCGEDSSEDLQLVEKVLAGQLGAFRVLVEKYHERAYSIAYGIVGNREDAEDIVQESLVKAHRNLHTFKGSSSFYTWLFRIVHNYAIDYTRRRYRRIEVAASDDGPLELISADEGGPSAMSRTDRPDQALDRRELSQQIGAALDSLSPEHRAVLMLREIDGCSYEEISQTVGCSKGTVMSRLFHARKKMQQKLAHYFKENIKDNSEQGVL